MPRPNKPWYREASDTWVCKINGRLRTLARGKRSKADAIKALAEIISRLGTVETTADDLPLCALFDHFLDHAEKNLAETTYAWYRRHLVAALDGLGRSRLTQTLRPVDLTTWVDGEHERTAWVNGKKTRVSRPWAKSTRCGAIASVKAAYSWGFDGGLIAGNPIAKVKSPGTEQRESIVDADTAQLVLDLVDEPFRDLLEFLHETGARPSEGYRVEADDVDLENGLVVMKSKTTARTRKPRVLYLTARAVEIVRRRAEAFPTGPLFRNRLGNPWKPSAVGWRFVRLRREHGFGPELMAEAFRHGWVTDALMRGVPEKIVAELAGHQSTAMISKHYAHLARRAKELRAHAEDVRRSE